MRDDDRDDDDDDDARPTASSKQPVEHGILVAFWIAGYDNDGGENREATGGPAPNWKSKAGAGAYLDGIADILLMYCIGEYCGGVDIDQINVERDTGYQWC